MLGLSLGGRLGLFIALTLGYLLLGSSSSHATEFTGKVVGVKDSDSLVVRQDNATRATSWK
jgi:hypothetical protein